jgi:hypothetical protein
MLRVFLLILTLAVMEYSKCRDDLLVATRYPLGEFNSVSFRFIPMPWPVVRALPEHKLLLCLLKQ